jgi:magnesium chelatase family protein
MFARTFSGGLNGVDAYCIEVECDCGGGMGQIHIVGLPDAAVKESQERVRSAIKACDIFMPYGKKWVVNLAPADQKKEGPAYDLPMAVGILASSGMLPTNHISKFWIIGELGLDGSVRPVSGVLPIALAARAYGAMGIILPEINAQEACLVEGLKIYPVTHLKQVCQILEDPGMGLSVEGQSRKLYESDKYSRHSEYDFRDVKGQSHVKQALEIAAAGRHNILMVGPPGSGKSMLAQRLPGIMPPLSFDEALELTKLYSVAGLLTNKASLVLERPFRAPHHSATAVGLVGGGAYPRPGEISLSHMGILFLDELTEFPRSHLDTLRQPLETNNVTISRAMQTLTFPASFLLVGACNPCPCGYRGDRSKSCSCTQFQADRYWSRLSGPFLDRIDLHVDVTRLPEEDLAGFQPSQSSHEIRLRVMRAVEVQRERCAEGRFLFNGQMTQKQLIRHCRIDEHSRLMLARAVTQLGLSARAYDRMLRIARTVADLSGHEDIERPDIAAAIRFRSRGRPQ